jgi:hypothetical protein
MEWDGVVLVGIGIGVLFFKALLLFFSDLHTLFAKLRYMHYGIVW